MLFNNKKGFSLAEVLITLGIVGVVAAITIPALIQHNKATRLRSQFLKSYSTLQQAFKLMENDDVSLDPRDYVTTSSGGLLATTIINYLKGATYCGYTGVACYKEYVGKNYKSFNSNDTTIWQLLDDGVILLNDGTLLMFENMRDSSIIYVSVDINGYKTKPNRLGYDVFTFQFLDGELKPMGSPGTDWTNDCSISYESRGWSCAYNAKNESDYFKKIVKLKI